jgi:hypothetical protein
MNSHIGAARLARQRLNEFLAAQPEEAQRLARSLRALVLRCIPGASEDVRFNSLCYFHPDAEYGAVGGNICLIEARAGRVVLSFIHGAVLSDPDRLLGGRGKSKRSVPITSAAMLRSPALASLIRAAAAREYNHR